MDFVLYQKQYIHSNTEETVGYKIGIIHLQIIQNPNW